MIPFIHYLLEGGNLAALLIIVWKASRLVAKLDGVVDNDLPHIYDELKALRHDLTRHLDRPK